MPRYVKGTTNVYFLVNWGQDPHVLLLQTIIGRRQNFGGPSVPSGDSVLCVRPMILTVSSKTLSNVERVVRVHGNLVLRKVMLVSSQQKVAWDSQTCISEPDRHTNEQGVDDTDDDDIDSDCSTVRQDQH